MSHFRVLNIGNNVEENMQSYNEQDEEYFQHVNRTEKDIKDYEKYAEGRCFEEFFSYWCGADTIYVKEDESETYGKIPQNDYCVVKRNDDGTEELLASYGWYNPNAKYDYYVEYSTEQRKGLLILKDGADKDYPTVKDVDWRGILKRSQEKRRTNYKHVVEVLGHAPAHKPFTEFKKEYEDENEARKLYEEQEDVKNYFEKEKPFWVPFYILDNFLCSEDEYAEKADLPFFAMNIEGKWFEEGEMGWWACVSNKKSEQEWSDLKKEIVERLTTEEGLQNLDVTILDCHI